MGLNSDSASSFSSRLRTESAEITSVYTVDTDPASTIDNEDAEDGSIPSINLMRFVKVYLLSDQTSPIHIHIDASSTISDLIQVILDSVSELSRLYSDELMCPGHWRLSRIDRNLLVTRIWLDPDQTVQACHINDGVRFFYYFLNSRRYKLKAFYS